MRIELPTKASASSKKLRFNSLPIMDSQLMYFFLIPASLKAAHCYYNLGYIILSDLSQRIHMYTRLASSAFERIWITSILYNPFN